MSRPVCNATHAAFACPRPSFDSASQSKAAGGSVLFSAKRDTLYRRGRLPCVSLAIYQELGLDSLLLLRAWYGFPTAEARLPQ